MFDNKKIFILGMARSGYNVAKLLSRFTKNIIITDMQDQDEEKVKELENLGIKFIKTDKPLELFDESFDYLVKNPGVFPNHEVVLKAKEENIPVLNEMELAYHFLPKDITIIGVTGSNGKTTTTTMIYDILKLMKKPVVLGGNIGYPLSEVIDKVQENDILLLEISDHQLINFNDFKTNISVLTNLYPTHLDYHGDYDSYKNVKKNIFNHHTSKDLAIINYTNDDSIKLTEDISSNKIYFNNEINYIKDGIYVNNEKIIDLNDIKLKGMHNYENILACLLVINEFGLDKEIIKEYFSSFGGVEHRMEFVLEKGGVSYYNDSKSTNPSSTIVALKSFDKPVHLILGGMERKQDFHELDDYIKYVKKIYAVGETTDKVYNYANEMNIECEKCETLKKAIEKIDASSGEVVLLSPASASWDQYKKFEDRGDEFKLLAKEKTS